MQALILERTKPCTPARDGAYFRWSITRAGVVMAGVRAPVLNDTSSFMLLIQRIITNWSKRSRGGDEAALRNSVPEALVVPEFELLDGYYVVHDVCFSEDTNYEADGRLRYCAMKTDVTISPLRLHTSRTCVSARFTWTRHDVGAPEREPSTLFQLRSGQWGRFRCNGRFGAETKTGRDWEYRKSVVNVAFAEAITHDIFVASAPDAEHARLAVLR